MELFLSALRREARKLKEKRHQPAHHRRSFAFPSGAAGRHARSRAADGRREPIRPAGRRQLRWPVDIARAAQRLAREVQAGHLQPEDITPGLLQGCLATGDLPLPDLCIRTGGEHRISNFLLWQLAYSELYSTCNAGLQTRGHAQGAGRFFQAASAASARPASRWKPRLVNAEQRIITALILLPIAPAASSCSMEHGSPCSSARSSPWVAWEWARLAGAGGTAAAGGLCRCGCGAALRRPGCCRRWRPGCWVLRFYGGWRRPCWCSAIRRAVATGVACPVSC